MAKSVKRVSVRETEDFVQDDERLIVGLYAGAESTEEMTHIEVISPDGVRVQIIKGGEAGDKLVATLRAALESWIRHLRGEPQGMM